MGARGRGVPRLRRLPAQDRPGDPGRAGREEELTAGSVEGRVVIVTGASDGIGAAAARRLHRSGAEVVLVGRSPEKTARIAGELGVESHTADFARLDDVRALAAALRERHPAIDVLVDNAGSAHARRELTVDGHEWTAQVGHLAPYLLTRLLEEPLRAAGGRVVVTASFMHWLGTTSSAQRLLDTRPYLANRAYAKAKLANVLMTRELARRWAPDVTATCFDPGAVATSFGARAGGITGLAFRTPLRAFFATPAQGADTLVWLVEASGGWRNGGYHAHRSASWCSPAARSDRRAAELWELSAAAVGLVSG